MAELTDEVRAELRRLLSVASPPPWTVGVVDDGDGSGRRVVIGAHGLLFGGFPAEVWMGPMLAQAEANPQLAVAAVNAVAPLLDSEAALRERAEAAEAKLAAIRKAFAYGGYGDAYPFDRLRRLIQNERAKCRNQDDRDYWMYLEQKFDAALKQ